MTSKRPLSIAFASINADPMPTGGVTLDNAGDWIRAGAVAVGVGSALVDGKAIDAGQFDVIAANARKVLDNVKRARSL